MSQKNTLRLGIASTLMVFILVLGSIISKQNSDIPYPASLKLDKIELWELHNSARKTPLSLNLALDEAAELHALWMSSNNKMSHRGANRTEPHERIISKKFNIAGENIAYRYETPVEVFNAWMNSSGHKKNILNQKFKYVGFGISAAEDGSIYWCTVLSD